MAHWTQNKPLSFRQRRAARLLTCGWFRDSQVATLVHVRRETIWAWRKQPLFQARLAELEREFAGHIHYQQRALLDLALTTLEHLVHSPQPRTSLAAMKTILRLNGRLR